MARVRGGEEALPTVGDFPSNRAVKFRETVPGVTVFLGFGSNPGGEPWSPRGDQKDIDRFGACSRAAAIAKADYNDAEFRDADGRWTGGGIAARVSPSLFDASEPEILSALARLGTRFSAPTAFLGALFIPTNSRLTRDGTLPDRPDIAYHYDLDTGTLALSQDGVRFYSGHVGLDGVFRDDEDQPVARAVKSSLVVDPQALPAPALRTGSKTETDREEPKLCPAPTPENFHGRSERAIAYQEQITQLPRGLDVVLTDPVTGKLVHFDGCCVANDNCLRDGDMLEAKGLGYDNKMASSTDWQIWFKDLAKMEKQITTQDRTAAADGRTVEWHFAEERPAAYFRGYAERKRLSNVKIFVTPAMIR